MSSTAFQPLHQSTDCCLRRDRDQQMNVVFPIHALSELDIMLPQMSRIRSRTRVAKSPVSAGLRYFVIQTR